MNVDCKVQTFVGEVVSPPKELKPGPDKFLDVSRYRLVRSDFGRGYVCEGPDGFGYHVPPDIINRQMETTVHAVAYLRDLTDWATKNYLLPSWNGHYARITKFLEALDKGLDFPEMKQ